MTLNPGKGWETKNNLKKDMDIAGMGTPKRFSFPFEWCTNLYSTHFSQDLALCLHAKSLWHQQSAGRAYHVVIVEMASVGDQKHPIRINHLQSNLVGHTVSLSQQANPQNMF